jgi:hypothetical protein
MPQANVLTVQQRVSLLRVFIPQLHNERTLVLIIGGKLVVLAPPFSVHRCVDTKGIKRC